MALLSKGGNKTPLPPAGTIPFQTVLDKEALYQRAPGGAATVAAAYEQQRVFNANAGYEDHPQSLRQWRGVVLALATDSKSAQVQVVGDTSSFWAPLELSGVVVGDRVVIDFRDEGEVAVVLIVQ